MTPTFSSATLILVAIIGVDAYQNTILPTGSCNITGPVDGLSVLVPIQENVHMIPTAWNPNYGAHIVVTGRDNKLYHKHQTNSTNEGTWTPWKTLTSDRTKIPCSSMPACRGYDNNPAIAWQPVNGTLVVFVRQMDDLTIHEMHLMDPTDPDSWSEMRGPSCLCNFPPCENQTRCGASAQCSNDGPDCSITPSTSRLYWSQSPPFPTSELTLLPEGDKLAMYYRGFDGGYFKTQQLVAGDAGGKFGPFYRLGSESSADSVIE